MNKITHTSSFRVSYVVRYEGFSESFDSLADVNEMIEEMAKGYPENEHMPEDSREYWRDMAKKVEVYYVTKVEHKIK
jgi:hypothetical protein